MCDANFGAALRAPPRHAVALGKAKQMFRVAAVDRYLRCAMGSLMRDLRL
jgi:hypothetical protein